MASPLHHPIWAGCHWVGCRAHAKLKFRRSDASTQWGEISLFLLLFFFPFWEFYFSFELIYTGRLGYNKHVMLFKNLGVWLRNDSDQSFRSWNIWDMARSTLTTMLSRPEMFDSYAYSRYQGLVSVTIRPRQYPAERLNPPIRPFLSRPCTAFSIARNGLNPISTQRTVSHSLASALLWYQGRNHPSSEVRLPKAYKTFI
jgi:hypothetical protein